MDLRVLKTKNSIEDSLFYLLERKDFKDITVQNILDTALINRSTFYRYYKDKYDLVEQIEAEYIRKAENHLTERFSVSDESELISVVDGIYTYLFKERDVIRHLWRIHTPELHIYGDFEKLLQGHVYNYLTRKNVDLQMAEYHSVLYASTILTTIRWLLEEKNFEKKDDVIDTLKDFLQHILR